MPVKKRKPAPKRIKPVTFVSVERVFKAQVKVRALRDLNGWANRERRVKWHIGAGRVGYIDEDHAREFSIKGYVEVLDGSIKPASDDEAAEILSTTTTIGLGAPNG